MAYVKRLCSGRDTELVGDNKGGTFGYLKATRTDYSFLPCVPFIPGLNYLGERPASRKKETSRSNI